MLKIKVIVVLLFVSLFGISQGELVVIYRLSNESQSIYNSDVFPEEDIKTSNTEDKHFIDEVSYNGEEWFVITSKLSYTGQTYNLTKDFPTDWINANWEKGYYITNLEFGDNKWLVVMSLGTGFTGQRLFSESNSTLISKKIKEAWDNKYRITCVAFGQNTSVFIMTAGSGLVGQSYHFSDEVPNDWLKPYYDKKYNVTCIAHTGDNWFTVVSTYSTQKAERYRNYVTYDFDKINTEYEAGYWIYKFCFQPLSKNQQEYLDNMKKAIAATDEEVAIFYYTEALKIVPNDALCLNNRAWSKFKLGQCDGAVDDIDKSLVIEETAYSLHTKASILVCQKRYNEAIDYFDRAVVLLNEPEAEYYYDRGRVKETIGDKNGAKQDFEKAIEIEPTNVDYKVHYELLKQKSELPIITWDAPYKSYSAVPSDICRIKLCVNSSSQIDDMKIFINNTLFESRGITIADECSQGIDQEIK